MTVIRATAGRRLPQSHDLVWQSAVCCGALVCRGRRSMQGIGKWNC